MDKEESLQQVMLGKLGLRMEKHETRSLPYTLHKNKLKIHQGLTLRHNTIKLLEESIKKTLKTMVLAKTSLRRPQKHRQQSKNTQVGFHQAKKLL